jgi:hypothetical protein
MIKISYICDTCGTVHSHTFDDWDSAQEYCSKQDRRDHTCNPNYDGTTYGQHAMTYHEIETGGYNDSKHS